MLNKLRNRQGFTLIELLIVVAIIGILAAIAIPQFSAYQKRGYASAVRADVANAHTAIKAWFSDDPARTTSLSADTTGPGNLQNYPSAKVSPSVHVVVTAAAEDALTITGTHGKLTAAGSSYILLGSGGITDTLSSSF